MIAVGVLVPLEHGRIGKAWLYADSLKDLARYVPMACSLTCVSDGMLLESNWIWKTITTNSTNSGRLIRFQANRLKINAQIPKTSTVIRK